MERRLAYYWVGFFTGIITIRALDDLFSNIAYASVLGVLIPALLIAFASPISEWFAAIKEAEKK